jgi:hypothetical protein
MRTGTALALLAIGLSPGRGQAADDAPEAPATPAPAPAAAATFETVAESATRTNDVATLIGAFVDRCDGEKREIDRVRCRASHAYLRQALPGRSFVIIADDPAAIAVSDYDAGVRGYRLALSACLACSRPVPIGRTGEARFVTLKTPLKTAGHEGDALAKAVEIANGAIGFESIAQAKRWLAGVRPLLRAQLVFKPGQPIQGEWRFGAARGYAMELVAGRIYNRCTGEVLLSQPPSTGLVERPPAGTRPADACSPADLANSRAEGGDADRDDDRLPSELSRTVIADSMSQIRGQVFACYEQHHAPGVVQLTYEVAGNGVVQSIKLGGAFDGTPTGACVLDAAKNARFPRFDAKIQTFTYPFFLRK